VFVTFYSSSITSKAGTVLATRITVRVEDLKVPDAADIALEKNEGVLIDACYVYADMVDSSGLAHKIKKPVGAKIVRSYVNGASDILRHYGGEIRGFDGDRVMAIFIGTDKETNAVGAGLAINWFVEDYLRDKINEEWADLKEKNIWTLNHGIGIDVGEALLTRTGVRGDNDLISVGSAPNTAAKLSAVRDGHALHITKEVYEPMSNEVAFLADGSCIWIRLQGITVGGRPYQVLASNAYREP
jgi:adenylate cyclase